MLANINIAVMTIIQHENMRYLEQLVSPKMLVSISTNILDMELDLIEDHDFHIQAVDIVKI